jgi:aryl-alcohol dehydrogenase-like predicted oxidoreductase
MKYILGTAAFGLNYGISNQFQQVEKESALQIIELALKGGFYGLDTAQSYGSAHLIVGDALSKNGNFHVTSKLSKQFFSTEDVFRSAIESCHKDLGCKKLDILLMHDFETLIDYDPVYVRRLLTDAKAAGWVSKIGLSVYSEDEVHFSKKLIPELEVFQIPENVVDGRLGGSLKLKELANAGNQFFARSIFLQGMLVSDPANLPLSLSPFSKQIKNFQEYCSFKEIDLVSACLSYIQSISWLEGVVIGVNSVMQLNEITAAINSPRQIDFSRFPKIDPIWLDPRLWKF